MIESHPNHPDRPARAAELPSGGLPGHAVFGGVTWFGVADSSGQATGGRQTVVIGSAHGHRLLELLRGC